MAKADKLQRVKKLLHLRGRHPAPSVNALVTELRSSTKLLPNPGGAEPFLPLEKFMIVWSYGVPFGEMDRFHAFLKDNEHFIEAACKASMQDQVAYLGTYLNTGGATPLYQTYWGYRSLDAINLWDKALKVKKSRFYKVIETLRSYWASDPGRSEQQYGLAAYYADLANLPRTNAITALTIDIGRNK